VNSENQHASCPLCNGQLTSDVARGWCEGEWSDYYCHHCQQDFFEWQIAKSGTNKQDSGAAY